jgi:16S rRNA (adenine1518-N6/adenine1519-N6)-dimethyltransferase
MRPRRQRMGQHFLCDPRIAGAIAAALPAEPPRVVEIGPGRGALTAPLLERFGVVRAIELDTRLAAGLAQRLGDPPGLEVIPGDALTADLGALASGEQWALAANLPYSVGTAILRRIVPLHRVFPVVVVMLQLEVVERMLAGPGDPGRGLLSVEIQAQADAELLFRVPPRAFQPPPRVASAVVRLRLRPAPDHLQRALELTAEAFSHRRKKLSNALARVMGAAELEVAGIDPSVRPQELTLEEWLRLAAAGAGR